jgi:type 1 glutamine amidotransferase
MKQKIVLSMFAAAAGFWFTFGCLPVSADTNQIRVLLVTGQDHPAHQWRETAPALRQLLEQEKRIQARIVEDPHTLDTAALANYSVVILHFQNWQLPGPGAAARDNLKRYVENGGGLISVHFGCGAWQGEWPEFANIIGRVWDPKLRGHDPREKFTVKIVDGNHPITRGLKDYETDDELYTCLVGDAPIHLLAQAKSTVDHKDHAMAFTREYGKGRVFLTTLGHDVKGFANSSTAQLLRQACLWTAKQNN